MEGAELVVQELGIDDPAGWTMTKLFSKKEGFPPHLLGGLHKVRFIKGDASDKKREVGRQSDEDHSLTFDVDQLHPDERTRIQDKYTDPREIEKATREENLEKLAETIDHEAMHHAHAHTVPLSWLRRWKEVIADEDVQVTGMLRVTMKKGKTRVSARI